VETLSRAAGSICTLSNFAALCANATMPQPDSRRGLDM
jgi:hypothetical protein